MNSNIKVSNQISPEVITLLKETIWGLKGPRFKHLNIEQRIQSNPENIYFSYYKEGEIAGTVVFCIRNCNTNGTELKHVYTRYFSVSPKFRGQKIGEQLLEEADIYFEEKYGDTPTLFYAYIDKKNLRSSKIAQNLAYESFSEFRTHIFSRIKPKSVVQIKEIDFNQLVYFGNFNTYNAFPNQEINHTKCYGLYQKNQLIAGVRTLPTQWKIESLEGLQGFVLKNIISRIPYINRVFNRDLFDFIALDHLYMHPNCKPTDLQQLIETILYQEKKHIAISWLDTKDKTANLFKEMNNKGLLDKFNTEVPANIHFTVKNITKEKIEELASNPFSIIAADLT